MTELRHGSSRHILKRIIVRGTLILDTPTCLGKGDADSPTDLPLLRDSISDRALLTGSSIAGALRNYLRECDRGYNVRDRRNDPTTKLFGDLFAYEDEKELPERDKQERKRKDTQSPLIINDALSTDTIKAELRDGVKINSVTRTAQDKAKYDLELLEAGTQFPLCFELLIEKDSDEPALINALALALHGLESSNGSKSGAISIGGKKRRGFGSCHVKNWQAWQFDLTKDAGRWAWLTLDHWSTELSATPKSQKSIAKALVEAGFNLAKQQEDNRDRFFIHAKFKLASPLLIRSGQASASRAPDVVHLKSRRDGEDKPVLSGTSLAGVLRHRAERIVNTLGKAPNLINEIFGPDFTNDQNKEAKASRLIVHESVVENTTDLIQNRIAIDRFTGGAYHGALFNEQPIFGSDKTSLNLELELRQPKDYEIGLLLLLLKDLWTSDLPVGGASSIGRGRLQGVTAEMVRYTPGEPIQRWTILQERPDQPLKVSDPEELEKFVSELGAYTNKEVAT